MRHVNLYSARRGIAVGAAILSVVALVATLCTIPLVNAEDIDSTSTGAETNGEPTLTINVEQSLTIDGSRYTRTPSWWDELGFTLHLQEDDDASPGEETEETRETATATASTPVDEYTAIYEWEPIPLTEDGVHRYLVSEDTEYTCEPSSYICANYDIATSSEQQYITVNVVDGEVLVSTSTTDYPEPVSTRDDSAATYDDDDAATLTLHYANTLTSRTTTSNPADTSTTTETGTVSTQPVNNASTATTSTVATESTTATATTDNQASNEDAQTEVEETESTDEETVDTDDELVDTETDEEDEDTEQESSGDEDTDTGISTTAVEDDTDDDATVETVSEAATINTTSDDTIDTLATTGATTATVLAVIITMLTGVIITGVITARKHTM